jgi:hypothetical protein
MKMVKKLLLGLVAVAAVISLTGCMPKDDDNNAIKKGIGKYYIDYTYEKAADSTEKNYRAYRSTGLKHAGALVKLTFKASKDATYAPGTSELGVIFGLTENKTAKTRNFNIIALSKTGQWYVSTMTDIKDIKAYNFGASTTAAAGEPKEKEWVAIDSSTISMPAADADGNVSVYVWYQATKAGSYKWAVLDMTKEQADAWKALTKEEKKDAAIPNATKVLKSGTITGAFEAVTEDFKEPQYPISVYAMVSDKATLNGEWLMSGYYLEAEEE